MGSICFFGSLLQSEPEGTTHPSLRKTLGSGEIVPSKSSGVTLATVRVQVPILEGQKFRVWNVLKILGSSSNSVFRLLLHFGYVSCYSCMLGLLSS